MPTILTSSQQTFVDITDQRKLSAYITSNLPKTQSEDPNTLPHAYAPNWETSHLVLTPVIFLDQTNVALDASGLTISWKRKDGTGAESALSSGETVSGGILTVSQNKLSASSSGMITYICYISYYDSETKNTVNISSDITYTLVKNAENAKLAYVTADTYVFKYNTSSALVGATQATLSAQVQGVTVSKWQYLNSSGVWTDYPTTSDNTSITGGTLVVKPAHAVFFNNVAQIKLVTDDADVFDTISITKMYDGEQGQPGQAGAGGLSVILGNEAQNIACTTGGAVQMITYICYISYYDSETKNTVNISSDITYTLVKNAENAKLAYVTADTYVFKYNTSSALVGATQATLSAQVQGVTVSKWQYLNSSGVWTDYPTTSDNTSITGGTLVVKPAHAVFFNNVAQIKLVTDDADVFDTISITKMYDGEQGQPGQAGAGGLSVILGNEAQNIACTTGGAVQAAVDVTIPFTGYVGITQTPCTCTVGTLPTGVTVKSNTAATASASGSVVLTFAANATLGGASVLTGTIDLTFTISGKSVVKKFAWTKSNKGSNGASAVVFSVYAPNGTIVQNQSGSLVLATSAYSGTTEITTGATYQWSKYTAGKWTDISGATSDTLTVSGADIVNIQSYRCTMNYGGKSYVDVITVEDKSDPYVSEMLSIGGFTVKNNLGGLVPYVIVRTNQKEVDALLGNISETAPSTPTNGMFWYKIDHTAKTVTLMKYNGTTWAAATEKQSLTYTWYKQDKDGREAAFGKTGKVIYLSAEDIDSIATLQCDVSN